MVQREVQTSVGTKIRALRKRRHLSLTALAERIGVSKSLLSQVERGSSNPSLPVLRSLAEALDVPLFTLFVEDDLSDGVVRRDQRQLLQIPGSTVERQLLVPDLHRQIVLVAASLKPGDSTSSEATSHRGEECILVLSGRIEIEVGSTRITLDTGDSYYFDSKLPHLMRNATDQPAEIIAAISPPAGSRLS